MIQNEFPSPLRQQLAVNQEGIAAALAGGGGSTGGGGCPLGVPCQHRGQAGFGVNPCLWIERPKSRLSLSRSRGTVSTALNREDEWHGKSGFRFYAKPVMLKTAGGF